MRPPDKSNSSTPCCVPAGLLWLCSVGLLMLLSVSHVSVGEDRRASWHQIDGACFCPNPSVTINCSLFCVSQTRCAEELAGGDNTLCYLLAEPVPGVECLMGLAITGYCIVVELTPNLPPANQWCVRVHNPTEFGGDFFSFETELLQSSKAPITSIVVSSDSQFIRSIQMTFGLNTTASVQAAWKQGTHHGQCLLDRGEFVHTIHVATSLTYGIPAPSALTFVTTRKTCGPYGQPGTGSYTYSGTRLVYVRGRIGDFFDRLEFVFGWC